MRYVSLCSGIEAATVGWEPLGWEPLWFSEVEPFCCSLLNHHYPNVPNLGDMTTITEATLERFPKADVLVGGTPCQSFSVAGLRGGMDDPRGNLALRFLQLAGVLRPRWIVWENVPGVHSSWTDAETPSAPSEESCRTIREAGLDPRDFEEVEQDADFGCFLTAVSQLGYGFAYRIMDAQYFGVPQRRRRVFVVGYLGDWRRAAAVLLERESLRRHPPPSREAGARVAGTIKAGFDRCYNDRENEPNLVAHCLARGSTGSHGRYDPNGEDYITCPVTSNPYGDHESRESLLLPVPIHNTDIGQYGNLTPRIGSGVGEPGDPMFTLGQRARDAIAFTCKDHGQDVGEQSPTLRGMQHDKSTPNAGGQVAVMYQQSEENHEHERGEGQSPGEDGPVSPGLNEPRENEGDTGDSRTCEAMSEAPGDTDGGGAGGPVAFQTRFARNGRGVPEEVCPTLQGAGAGATSDMRPCVQSGMAVRRLTPRECERLQGFPDDYTLIEYNGKPAKDGPRYRALGNSMAVPCMTWLGERIAATSPTPSESERPSPSASP